MRKTRIFARQNLVFDPQFDAILDLIQLFKNYDTIFSSGLHAASVVDDAVVWNSINL